jgi:hypothetical protein
MPVDLQLSAYYYCVPTTHYQATTRRFLVLASCDLHYMFSSHSGVLLAELEKSIKPSGFDAATGQSGARSGEFHRARERGNICAWAQEQDACVRVSYFKIKPGGAVGHMHGKYGTSTWRRRRHEGDKRGVNYSRPGRLHGETRVRPTDLLPEFLLLLQRRQATHESLRSHQAEALRADQPSTSKLSFYCRSVEQHI